MDAVEKEHSPVGLEQNGFRPGLVSVEKCRGGERRGGCAGGEKLSGGAGDEWALWDGAGGVERSGGEGASGALFSFNGREG